MICASTVTQARSLGSPYEMPGAVLCFLPGWAEIRQMEERLAQSSKIWAVPLHSTLPKERQQHVFRSHGEGLGVHQDLGSVSIRMLEGCRTRGGTAAVPRGYCRNAFQTGSAWQGRGSRCSRCCTRSLFQSSSMLRKPPKGKVKVILGTNIADSSVTINDATGLITQGLGMLWCSWTISYIHL